MTKTLRVIRVKNNNKQNLIFLYFVLTFLNFKQLQNCYTNIVATVYHDSIFPPLVFFMSTRSLFLCQLVLFLPQLGFIFTSTRSLFLHPLKLFQVNQTFSGQLDLFLGQLDLFQVNSNFFQVSSTFFLRRLVLFPVNSTSPFWKVFFTFAI